MPPQTTILGGIAGGLVALLVAGGFRLVFVLIGVIAGLVVGTVRAIMASLSGENAGERAQEARPAPSDALEVVDAAWIETPATKPLHRADARYLFSDEPAPRNLIAPFREPHDAITYLDGAWNDDDLISLYARAFAAHQNGLAFRPASHTDLILCEDSVMVEAMVRVPGGYRFANDFAFRAGREAHQRVYGRSAMHEAPPLGTARVRMTIDANLKLPR